MNKPKDCPFCNSLEHVVKENEIAQAILSDPHKVPGHILVMPKRHVQAPWDLQAEELQAIFELIFFIEQRFVGKLGEGIDIRQNYRPYMSQDKLKLNHLTFHLIPRSRDDYLYSISGKYEDGLYAELDDLEAKAVNDLLK
ncbi:HIT domain-containing protein [Aeromicrobium sp.]|nr:HIT domain-containing protein [Candidatus Saccharibacteria bacterium]